MGALSRAAARAGLLALFVGLPMAAPAAKPGGVALTPERMAELQRINDHVNATIVEVSDREHYGREDVWRIPTDGKGDCEDFALLKRKLLVERGWPASALSISLGMTAQGEAHAVLTVATSRGDLVLDNQRAAILPAAQTGITFHTRQSGAKPGRWVSATTSEVTSVPYADFPIASRTDRVAQRAR
jgi:predicted transglutaminase-like cysteine proteinase